MDDSVNILRVGQSNSDKISSKILLYLSGFYDIGCGS